MTALMKEVRLLCRIELKYVASYLLRHLNMSITWGKLNSFLFLAGIL